MNPIVEEKLVYFKTLEQEIYRFACEIGQEMTRSILEGWDASLAEGRDRKKYRDKGTRQTTIKTVYGEVTYKRHIYQTSTEEGKKAFIYLLDEAMGMEKIGHISANLAEKIAEAATESPYRVAAEQVSSMGQSVSAQGAWNVMQKIGEKISREEEAAVREMEMDRSRGEKEAAVLFEEMDGVWLPMQDEHHKKMKKQEMKIFTMYEGWDKEKEKEGRSSLVGKMMLAGMEKSAEFHEKREACIRKIYDADEIRQRILNGDGGSWIKEPYDPEAIFQLDRYHIYQEILRKISDKSAQKEIRRLFEEEKTEEMLEYIKKYADSVASNDKEDKRRKKALELYAYLSNNKEGLLPYQKRGIRIPEAKDGIIYKAMGVQENQNCTVITLRMKHRRMRWSVGGANNLAKALYKKENGELYETIERFSDGQVPAVEIRETVKTLSAAKAPKKDGKGNPYPDTIRAHMPLKDAVQTAARKVLCAAFS